MQGKFTIIHLYDIINCMQLKIRKKVIQFGSIFCKEYDNLSVISMYNIVTEWKILHKNHLGQYFFNKFSTGKKKGFFRRNNRSCYLVQKIPLVLR